jgi:hypothetical protein
MAPGELLMIDATTTNLPKNFTDRPAAVRRETGGIA